MVVVLFGGRRPARDPGRKWQQAIEDLRKPSIAVIDGICHHGRRRNRRGDESLRFAGLAPSWFGVGVNIELEGEKILRKP